jgi:hypothetical protein
MQSTEKVISKYNNHNHSMLYLQNIEHMIIISSSWNMTAGSPGKEDVLLLYVPATVFINTTRKPVDQGRIQ